MDGKSENTSPRRCDFIAGVRAVRNRPQSHADAFRVDP